MLDHPIKSDADDDHAARRQRRLDMQHLQAIEGNPLSPDQVAVFEMFEREGWSHERRLAYLQERARRRATLPAAE